MYAAPQHHDKQPDEEHGIQCNMLQLCSQPSPGAAAAMLGTERAAGAHPRSAPARPPSRATWVACAWGCGRGFRPGTPEATAPAAAASPRWLPLLQGKRAVLRESLAGGDSGKGTPDSAIACTLSAPAAASNCSASGTEDCLLSGKVHMLPSGCVWPRREDTRIPCDFVLVDIINRYTHSL